MYNGKCKFGGSEALFSYIFELLADAFDYSEVPPSFYEAKKIISKMGLKYIKIDVCENDCMLFWEDDRHLDRCRRCNASRYLEQK